MEAKERRSGNPSSMAVKPAEEMAESLEEKGVELVPTETLANEAGICVRDSGEIIMMRNWIVRKVASSDQMSKI